MHLGVEDGTVLLHVNMQICKYAHPVGTGTQPPAVQHPFSSLPNTHNSTYIVLFITCYPDQSVACIFLLAHNPFFQFQFQHHLVATTWYGSLCFYVVQFYYQCCFRFSYPARLHMMSSRFSNHTGYTVSPYSEFSEFQGTEVRYILPDGTLLTKACLKVCGGNKNQSVHLWNNIFQIFVWNGYIFSSFSFPVYRGIIRHFNCWIIIVQITSCQPALTKTCQVLITRCNIAMSCKFQTEYWYLYTGCS